MSVPVVAIIGAGYAGLACAVELARAGVHVTVFERSHTLGGRARVVHKGGHWRVDNGQHILIGAYSELTRLLRVTGVSPKQLEHLWRGYLGALGAYALEAADIAVRWAEGAPPRAERRWDEVPVVKAFVRESPAFSTRYRTELYEMAREAEQLYRTVRALREEGRAEEARALAEANAEKLKARPGLQRATEGLSHVRAQMDRVQRAADMRGAEKRARLDALIGRRNAVAKGAVERAQGVF